VITHVALVNWKPETPQGQAELVAERLLALKDVIPSIRTYVAGPNVGAEGNFDFGVVATFDDVEGWREYSAHPAHTAIANELMVPWASGAAVIQF
jgi:hypothetical protein